MIDWITAHGQTIIAVLFGLHAVAVAIVNLTPTPDKYKPILSKVYKGIEVLAGLFSKKAKEDPKDPIPPTPKK